jgi:hypothetical protein
MSAKSPKSFDISVSSKSLFNFDARMEAAAWHAAMDTPL